MQLTTTRREEDRRVALRHPNRLPYSHRNKRRARKPNTIAYAARTSSGRAGGNALHRVLHRLHRRAERADVADGLERAGQELDRGYHSPAKNMSGKKTPGQTPLAAARSWPPRR